MTSLDIMSNMPLNIALVHVNKSFEPISMLNLFINLPVDTPMSDWVKREHGRTPPSGGPTLLDTCLRVGVDIEAAKRRVKRFILRAGMGRPVVLVGTSVDHDKAMLNRVFELQKLVHFHTRDLTSFNLFLGGSTQSRTGCTHWAIDDVMSTLSTLRDIKFG